MFYDVENESLSVLEGVCLWLLTSERPRSLTSHSPVLFLQHDDTLQGKRDDVLAGLPREPDVCTAGGCHFGY